MQLIWLIPFTCIDIRTSSLLIISDVFPWALGVRTAWWSKITNASGTSEDQGHPRRRHGQYKRDTSKHYLRKRNLGAFSSGRHLHLVRRAKGRNMKIRKKNNNHSPTGIACALNWLVMRSQEKHLAGVGTTVWMHSCNIARFVKVLVFHSWLVDRNDYIRNHSRNFNTQWSVALRIYQPTISRIKLLERRASLWITEFIVNVIRFSALFEYRASAPWACKILPPTCKHAQRVGHGNTIISLHSRASALFALLTSTTRILTAGNVGHMLSSAHEYIWTPSFTKRPWWSTPRQGPSSPTQPSLTNPQPKPAHTNTIPQTTLIPFILSYQDFDLGFEKSIWFLEAWHGFGVSQLEIMAPWINPWMLIVCIWRVTFMESQSSYFNTFASIRSATAHWQTTQRLFTSF